MKGFHPNLVSCSCLASVSSVTSVVSAYPALQSTYPPLRTENMKKLVLITLVLAFFCSALSFAGYVGFQLLAGKVPTPVHVQDRIAITNDLEQLRIVSLDAIRDNDILLESTWKLTLSILLFTAVEFAIIAMLLVFVFREIRKAKVADAGRSQTSSGS